MRKAVLPVIAAMWAAFTILLPGNLAAAEEARLVVNAGDTAFIIICAGMVLLMTPGLGLFYGGMVRKKMFSLR